MKMDRKLLLTSLIILSFLGGCAGTKVKRVQEEAVVDLSGRWNDTDSRLVAEEVIEDCLSRPWLAFFSGQNNRAPVVIVGPISNQSHEHINAELFTKNLEKSLLNSGKVKFVASDKERGSVRAERQAQHQGFTAQETIKAIGQETGADYILIGSINSIKDENKGRYVILYQVNLELIDLENNQKAWIGQKHIKKVIKRSRYSL